MLAVRASPLLEVHKLNNKNMKLAKVDTLDVEELACHITGLDYDEIDADTTTIEEKLYEEFGCDVKAAQKQTLAGPNTSKAQ